MAFIVPYYCFYGQIIGVRLQTSEGSAKEVLLGVATFDLSELVKGWWEVRLTNSLYHPRAVYCPTIHEPNDEKVSILEKDSPLTSNMLMSFGTCLKVKVRVAYDLRAVYQDVLHHDGILNRIFIILNDLELAREILNDALAHNHNLLFAFQSSEECMESEVNIVCNYKVVKLNCNIVGILILNLCDINFNAGYTVPQARDVKICIVFNFSIL